MACSKCKNDLPRNGDFVTCGNCKNQYHYECSNISATTWKAKSQSKKANWKCVSCRNQNKNETTSPKTSEPKPPEDPSFIALKKILEEMFQKQEKLLTNKIAALQETINQFQSSMDSILGQVKTLEENNKAMSLEIEDLKTTLEAEKQYARSKNFVIAGIPQKKDENVKEDICRLLAKMNLQVKQEELTIHRLPDKDGNSPVFVQCYSRETRDKIVRHARKLKPNLKLLDNSKSDKPIYFNDHLTPYYVKLMIKAKAFVRDRKFKYIWLDGNKIMIKKGDKDKPFKIQKDSDFDLCNT